MTPKNIETIAQTVNAHLDAAASEPQARRFPSASRQRLQDRVHEGHGFTQYSSELPITRIECTFSTTAAVQLATTAAALLNDEGLQEFHLAVSRSNALRSPIW